MKHEIKTVKYNVKNVEKGDEEVWATVDDLKEEVKALKDTGKGIGRTAIAVNENQSRTQGREGKYY